MHKRLWICALSIFSVHCAEEGDELPVVTQSGAVAVLPDGSGNSNGGSYNGGSYNGGSYNGGSYNGGSYNGGSYNGLAYAPSFGLTGFGMNGSVKHTADTAANNIGYDGTSYPTFSDLGWSYNESTRVGTRKGMSLVPGSNLSWKLGLHDWIAHTDTNGNTGPTVTTTPAHYCAGMESPNEMLAGSYSVPSGGYSSTFQRSTGGTSIEITLDKPAGTAVQLMVKVNDSPLYSPDCYQQNYSLSHYSCVMNNLNPGDTVFVKAYNKEATAVSVDIYANQLGTNACDDPTDIANRLNALKYLIKCMCPSNVSVAIGPTDYHTQTPAEYQTLSGALNLGPTWCTGATNTVVPNDELQAVSACYMAHLNSKGTHVPISLRGSSGTNNAGSPLNPTAGELIMDATPIGMYFGNIFTAGSGCRAVGAATTGTVPGLGGNRSMECCSSVASTSPPYACVAAPSYSSSASYDQRWVWNSTTSKWWFNSNRYVAQRGVPEGSSTMTYDAAVALGRTCDVDGCDRITNVGNGNMVKANGALGLWPITGDGKQNPMFSPSTFEGVYSVSYNGFGNNPNPPTLTPCQTNTGAPCNDSTHPVTGGGLTYRQLNLYIGLMANYEPSKIQGANYVPPDPTTGQPQGDDAWSYTRALPNTVPPDSTQEVTCALDAYSKPNCFGGKRLTGLKPSQVVESIFRYKPLSNVQFLPPNLSLANAYAEPLTVAVRYSNPDSTPRYLNITAALSSSSSDFTLTTLTDTPFPPTGGSETYKTLYLYGVYMKPYYPGGVSTPHALVRLQGKSGTTGAQSPDLDGVQIFSGPPPCGPPPLGGICIR